MKADRDNFYYVKLVLEHCRRIEKFTQRFHGSKELLYSDMAYQQAVTMSILQIGECVYDMDDDFKQKYSEQPWDDIIKARHKMTHHYDEVNVEFVWEMIEHDIPLLKEYCEMILKEECR